MGKVVIVKKSRKECTCNKCNTVIPVGSQYYRGELNFSKPIIRCNNCKLESWEVTTSDYQLSVGAIVYKWSENYDASQDGVDAIISDLESIRDDLGDRLDNMPEGLQYSDTGELLQNRIDCLDSAIDSLNDIDEANLKSEVAEEANIYDSDEEFEFDEDNEEMVSALEEKYSEAIEEALSEIEI